MAVQNSTITVKGKLGNIVGYKGRSGQRLARIRQTEVKNPKTVAQTIQRMIIATASRAYGLMKTICDHSFEGITYGGESQSYFLKQAANDLRAYVAANYPEFNVSDFKNLFGLSFPNDLSYSGVGLMISKGTIPSVAVKANTDGDALIFGETLSGATIQNVMDAVGARPGDQITICGINSDGEWVESRYVIDNEATTAQLAVNWPANGVADAFDAQTSVVEDAQLKVDSTDLTTDLTTAAVILSRKQGTKWLRSTQRLYTVDIQPDGFGAEDAPAVALAAWMEGTTPIETENPYYLNQAEQVGE